MLNFLLADADASSAKTGSSWWIYVVLIVLVVLMLVLPAITNRRRMKEYTQMVDRLRVGDEVKTIGGIIGRVTKIVKTDTGATFILETGAKGTKTTMEFDINAIGTVLKSTYVEEPKPEEKPKAEKAEEPAKEQEASAEPAKEEPAEPAKAEGSKAEEIEKQITGKKSSKSKK